MFNNNITFVIPTPMTNTLLFFPGAMVALEPAAASHSDDLWTEPQEAKIVYFRNDAMPDGEKQHCSIDLYMLLCLAVIKIGFK